MRILTPALVLVALCLLGVACGSDGHSTRADAAPKLDGKAWCTESACVVGDYDSISPQLLQHAIDQMGCSNYGVSMAVDPASLQILIVCP